MAREWVSDRLTGEPYSSPMPTVRQGGVVSGVLGKSGGVKVKQTKRLN